MSELSVHSLADLIPEMSKAEYRELVEDIKANGLHEPITLYEGKILDGRNRARACREAGVKVKTQEYEGDDPAKYVISLNVHRRHLTTTQRAEIALAVLPHYKEQAKERQAVTQLAGRKPGGEPIIGPGHKTQTDTHHNRARDAAAADVGVSGITVARLERVAREAPDLHAKVQAGEMTATSAWQKVRERGNGHRPKAVVIETKRQRETAQAAKSRVEKVVGTCNGLARGLQHIKVAQAVAVADPAEISGWIEAMSEARSALNQFQKQIKEVT